MARIRDFFTVTRRVGPVAFAKSIWREVSDDNVFMLASALAYSWLFAIFPFFIFLLSLLPYLPANVKSSVQTQLSARLHEQLPKQAENVLTNLDVLMNQPKGKLLSVGLLVTIWAASGGMAMTMAALDSAFDVKDRRPFYKQRPLAVLLTIVVATLILIVLALLPLGTFAANFAAKHGGDFLQDHGWNTKWLTPILVVWQIVRFSLSFLLLFMVLAILYHYGTAAKTRLRFLSPGAIFCVIVWLLLGALFRFYVDKYGKYEKTYGTVGGVAILLLFFYIDALVLLTGAEINAEVECNLRDVLPPGEAAGNMDCSTDSPPQDPVPPPAA